MWILAVLTVLFFLLRLWWLPRGAEGWDAVDFLLALKDYDLERFQPHFPGYPVYVFAASAVHALGLSAGTAYRSVNALCGALLPLALHGTVITRRGEDALSPPRPSTRWSPLALFLTALSPALLLASVRIESDLPGLLFVVLAFRAGVSGRRVLSGFLAGVTLGLRLGAAPLVAGWGLWVLRRGRHAPGGRRWLLPAAGLLGGVALWLVPLYAIEGAALWREGLFFVRGHFTDWGGTAFAEQGWVRRWGVLVSTLGRGLAGTSAWPGILGAAMAVGVGCILYVRRRGRGNAVFLYWLLPQLFTLVFLQNPARSRHDYPVILALVAASFLGWGRARGALRVLGLMIMLAFAVQGLSLLAQRSVELPPALRAVRAAIDSSGKRDAWVFCGATRRLFDLEDPQRRLVVRRARDLGGVRAELNGSLAPPRSVLVFSDVEMPAAAPESVSFRGDPALFDDPVVDIYCYLVTEPIPGGELQLTAVAPYPELLRAARR